MEQQFLLDIEEMDKQLILDIKRDKQEKIQNGRGSNAYMVFMEYMRNHDYIPFKDLPNKEQYAWIGMANTICGWDRIFWNDVPTLELHEHTIVRDKEPHIEIRYLM